MNNLIHLIPFTVKVRLPSFSEYRPEWILESPNISELEVARKDQYQIDCDILSQHGAISGEYTVVGATEDMFLLIRPNELSHWYPQNLCEVVE